MGRLTPWGARRHARKEEDAARRVKPMRRLFSPSGRKAGVTLLDLAAVVRVDDVEPGVADRESRHLAHLVPGTTHTLQGARDRGR